MKQATNIVATFIFQYMVVVTVLLLITKATDNEVQIVNLLTSAAIGATVGTWVNVYLNKQIK